MKKLLITLLSLLMVFALVGCQKQESADNNTDGQQTEEPTVEKVDLNVAYMPNYAALWAVTTGINKGYFEEEGLNINLVEFADGPTEIAAMESGSIDLSYIGPGAHRLCSTGDAQVFLIQQIGDADCVLGFKSKGVEKLEDLKGKKVAYAGGTSSETILDLALEAAGLTRGDVELYDMDAASMATAAISGSVDAVATWSPYSLNIMSELGDDVVKMCSNVTFADKTVSPASWVVNPKYAAENSDVIVRFIRAMYKAMDYGSKEANFDEVAGYVADQCKQDKQVAFDQRGDGDWFNKADVLNMIKDGTIIKYYELQKQSFIDAGRFEGIDLNTLVEVKDFVLTNLMEEAGK